MSDFFSQIIFIFSKAPSSPPRHNNGSSSNSNGTKLEPENVAKDGASEKPDLEESDGNMEISSESESETPKKSRKKKRKKEKNSKSSKVRYFVTKKLAQKPELQILPKTITGLVVLLVVALK